MSRYMSDIKDGEVYKLALDNYQTYLKTKTNSDKRVIGGGVVGERQRTPVLVQAFGAEDKIIVPTSAKGFEGLKGILTAARVTESLTGGVEDALFKPAVFTGMATSTRASSRVKSKRTGLYYIKYGGPGDSMSCAFGAKSATEEFEEGRAAVIAAFKTANATKKYIRVSVRGERILGR